MKIKRFKRNLAKQKCDSENVIVEPKVSGSTLNLESFQSDLNEETK